MIEQIVVGVLVVGINVVALGLVPERRRTPTTTLTEVAPAG